ncbi:MAG: hypothetical protein F6K30_21845 [Cyanothece sp. SIO2G6]|nr:hypothetical protein [Cyanothece sp. SIO2G6]
MPYHQFQTITSAKRAFGLTSVEGHRLFSDIPSVKPSDILSKYLEQTLPLASVGSEKARSELVIAPILIEVRRMLEQSISIFSGEEFNVDESLGLCGPCDFLVSQSQQILGLESPPVMVIEARKADIAAGIGQCVATMVAAQYFNQEHQCEIACVYGIVTDGILWRFLRLIDHVVTIDAIDYSIPPVDQVLGILKWILDPALQDD